MKLSKAQLSKIIESCLAEDIGTGDITTNSIVPIGAQTSAVIHAKETGVIAGVDVAEAVFHFLSPTINFTAKVMDGELVGPGTVIAEVSGDAEVILTGERLALNFLQRMSGVATRTAGLVAKVSDYAAKIVDTRKTTPGLRLLEKYAVRVGGGYNHRFGLYDAVLIKDNHIQVAGGIAKAIELARYKISHTLKIEVEVESIAGVQEALAAGADIIMLDNMDQNMMREAVALIKGRALTEASGGINEDNIQAVAAVGVDLISVGALTHSVKALDISLDIGQIK